MDGVTTGAGTRKSTTSVRRPALTHDALVKSVYESALAPEQWAGTLTQVRHYLKASAFSLFSLDSHAEGQPPLFTENMSREWLEAYQTYWGQHDVWVRGAMEKNLVLPGNTVSGRMMVDRRTLQKSHFYNEGLVPEDIRDVISSGLWGQEPGSPRLILSLYRGLKSKDFDEPDHAKLTGLVDHLHRAITIGWKLGTLKQNQGLNQSLLDGLNQAIFLMDAQRRVIHANAMAERMMDDKTHYVSLRQGRLLALGSQSIPSLEEAIALADQGFSIPISFTHIRESGSMGIGGAHLLRLNEPSGWVLEHSRARYALIIEPGNRVDRSALAALGKLFKLTAAEQTVLLHLMQDATPEEIAAQLGISLHTVRSQIKSLREKTGVRRITELVHMAQAATRGP